MIGGSLVYMQHLQIDSVNTITYCAVPTAARYEKKPHIKSQQQYHWSHLHIPVSQTCQLQVSLLAAFVVLRVQHFLETIFSYFCSWSSVSDFSRKEIFILSWHFQGTLFASSSSSSACHRNMQKSWSIQLVISCSKFQMSYQQHGITYIDVTSPVSV